MMVIVVLQPQWDISGNNVNVDIMGIMWISFVPMDFLGVSRDHKNSLFDISSVWGQPSWGIYNMYIMSLEAYGVRLSPIVGIEG